MTDLFTPTEHPLDETCEISRDPPVTIDIPFGIFSRSDVLDTVKKAVDLVVEAKQEQLEQKEKKTFSRWLRQRPTNRGLHV